jgi:hypothetical protein
MTEEQTEPKDPTSGEPLKENVITRDEVPRQSQGITERRGVPSGAPGTPEDTGKLAEMEAALSEARQSLDARAGDCDRLKAALDDAMSAYRKLAVSASPLYSEDIISGSSVEEIDASIKKVNGLVKKMRSSLEAELKDLTIPAGAPERSAPDTSGLSPREKIKQGLDKK